MLITTASWSVVQDRVEEGLMLNHQCIIVCEKTAMEVPADTRGSSVQWIPRKKICLIWQFLSPSVREIMSLGKLRTFGQFLFFSNVAKRSVRVRLKTSAQQGWRSSRFSQECPLAWEPTRSFVKTSHLSCSKLSHNTNFKAATSSLIIAPLPLASGKLTPSLHSLFVDRQVHAAPPLSDSLLSDWCYNDVVHGIVVYDMDIFWNDLLSTKYPQTRLLDVCVSSAHRQSLPVRFLSAVSGVQVICTTPAVTAALLTLARLI